MLQGAVSNAPSAAVAGPPVAIITLTNHTSATLQQGDERSSAEQ
jgi:hypothetical protein